MCGTQIVFLLDPRDFHWRISGRQSRQLLSDINAGLDLSNDKKAPISKGLAKDMPLPFMELLTP